MPMLKLDDQQIAAVRQALSLAPMALIVTLPIVQEIDRQMPRKQSNGAGPMGKDIYDETQEADAVRR